VTTWRKADARQRATGLRTASRPVLRPMGLRRVGRSTPRSSRRRGLRSRVSDHTTRSGVFATFGGSGLFRPGQSVRQHFNGPTTPLAAKDAPQTEQAYQLTDSCFTASSWTGEARLARPVSSGRSRAAEHQPQSAGRGVLRTVCAARQRAPAAQASCRARQASRSGRGSREPHDQQHTQSSKSHRRHHHRHDDQREHDGLEPAAAGARA